DLRREIVRDLVRQRGEKLIGALELPVHTADRRRLASLHGDEGKSGDGNKDEIGQQVLVREYVAGNCLADGDLLDAAYVADLPVALRAFRMRVVAVDADGSHHHGRDQADAVAKDR